MQYDYLIVGQGLAGSALSLQLMKRNRRFLVIDQPGKNISSVVAAGIYNPITGKNWVKTWMADSIFPYMENFYRDAEQKTKRHFLNKKMIYRPFSTLSEQNDWMGRSENSIYKDYIEAVYTNAIDEEIIHNPYGGLKIRKAGYLNIIEYLKSVRDILIQNECFSDEYFDFKDVVPHNGNNYYIHKGRKFRMIIFCEGPMNSALWNFLPFRQVKGEILTVNIKMDLDVIFNKGVFILPLGEGVCKVGATYEYKKMDIQPSNRGKYQLEEMLNSFFKPEYTIAGQTAGIRPSTIDRKPFLGRHPDDKNIVIFNGLGTKGVTLAPYFSDHLLNSIENDHKLIKEVDIKRFIR